MFQKSKFLGIAQAGWKHLKLCAKEMQLRTKESQYFQTKPGRMTSLLASLHGLTYSKGVLPPGSCKALRDLPHSLIPQLLGLSLR